MKRFLIAVLLSGVMMAEAVLPAVAAPSKAPLQEVLEEDEGGLFGSEEVYEEEDALPELEEAFDKADDSLFEQEEVYEEDDILEVDEISADSTNPPYSLLFEDSFSYDGTQKKPEIKVLDSNGRPLPPSDYRVIYERDCKDVGAYGGAVVIETPRPYRLHFDYTIYPPKPSIKKITFINKTSVKIQIDGNPEGIDHYKLSCWSDSRRVAEVEIPNTQTTYVLTELEGNTKYKVSVCSVKKFYRSDWSEEEFFTPSDEFEDEEILSYLEEIRNKEGYRNGDFLSNDLKNSNFKYTNDIIVNGDKRTINAAGMEAFALDVSDQIFGKHSPVYYQHRDRDNFKVGDIVIWGNFTEYGVVTKVRKGRCVEMVSGNLYTQSIDWYCVVDFRTEFNPIYRFCYIWTRRK